MSLHTATCPEREWKKKQKRRSKENEESDTFRSPIGVLTRWVSLANDLNFALFCFALPVKTCSGANWMKASRDHATLSKCSMQLYKALISAHSFGAGTLITADWTCRSRISHSLGTRSSANLKFRPYQAHILQRSLSVCIGNSVTCKERKYSSRTRPIRVNHLKILTESYRRAKELQNKAWLLKYCIEFLLDACPQLACNVSKQSVEDWRTESAMMLEPSSIPRVVHLPWMLWMVQKACSLLTVVHVFCPVPSRPIGDWSRVMCICLCPGTSGVLILEMPT